MRTRFYSNSLSRITWREEQNGETLSQRPPYANGVRQERGREERKEGEKKAQAEEKDGKRGRCKELPYIQTLIGAPICVMLGIPPVGILIFFHRLDEMAPC